MGHRHYSQENIICTTVREGQETTISVACAKSPAIIKPPPTLKLSHTSVLWKWTWNDIIPADIRVMRYDLAYQMLIIAQNPIHITKEAERKKSIQN